jgi:hypothetical protein
MYLANPVLTYTLFGTLYCKKGEESKGKKTKRRSHNNKQNKRETGERRKIERGGTKRPANTVSTAESSCWIGGIYFV